MIYKVTPRDKPILVAVFPAYHRHSCLSIFNCLNNTSYKRSEVKIVRCKDISTHNRFRNVK